MIISTFQGMGKSTLAKDRQDIIDLESSCFDKSHDTWYLDYCRVAMDLDRQGYIVFVSAHKPVRDYLRKMEFLKYYMLMYTEKLKDYAVNKVASRYNESQTLKDYAAYMKAKNAFDSIVKEIRADAEDGLPVIWVDDENYNLEDIINKLVG